MSEVGGDVGHKRRIGKTRPDRRGATGPADRLSPVQLSAMAGKWQEWRVRVKYQILIA